MDSHDINTLTNAEPNHAIVEFGELPETLEFRIANAISNAEKLTRIPVTGEGGHQLKTTEEIDQIIAAANNLIANINVVADKISDNKPEISQKNNKSPEPNNNPASPLTPQESSVIFNSDISEGDFYSHSFLQKDSPESEIEPLSPLSSPASEPNENLKYELQIDTSDRPLISALNKPGVPPANKGKNVIFTLEDEIILIGNTTEQPRKQWLNEFLEKVVSPRSKEQPVQNPEEDKNTWQKKSLLERQNAKRDLLKTPPQQTKLR